jgi:hypothetical protein
MRSRTPTVRDFAGPLLDLTISIAIRSDDLKTNLPAKENPGHELICQPQIQAVSGREVSVGLLGDKTMSVTIAGMTCMTQFYLLSNCALCFSATPLTHVGYVD